MTVHFRKSALVLLPSLSIFLAQFVNAADSVAPSKPLPPGVRTLEAAGIHNMFALGMNLFSGSSPEGEASFEALARLGIKTIITVDGAKPDVATARKHGLRYVHLPHGYDGISTNVQAQLVQAAESLPGPFYVHCHHGMHRGPAAAAVICMAENGWSPAQAEAWLSAAGTATNYTGLYDVVRTFRKPSTAQLRALLRELPEVAKVSALIDSMVEIDNRWDSLKAVRAAGYQIPKDNPDIKPANEALILWEHFREAQRFPDSEKRGDKFIDLLKTAENQTKEAEQLLRAFATTPTLEIRRQLDISFDAVGKSCSTCHKAYRDPARIKLK